MWGWELMYRDRLFALFWNKHNSLTAHDHTAWPFETNMSRNVSGHELPQRIHTYYTTVVGFSHHGGILTDSQITRKIHLIFFFTGLQNFTSFVDHTNTTVHTDHKFTVNIRNSMLQTADLSVKPQIRLPPVDLNFSNKPSSGSVFKDRVSRTRHEKISRRIYWQSHPTTVHVPFRLHFFGKLNSMNEIVIRFAGIENVVNTKYEIPRINQLLHMNHSFVNKLCVSRTYFNGVYVEERRSSKSNIQLLIHDCQATNDQARSWPGGSGGPDPPWTFKGDFSESCKSGDFLWG